MDSCPKCELPRHAGETCEHALGRALATSFKEIRLLREELKLLGARKPAAVLAPRWHGTLRG